MLPPQRFCQKIIHAPRKQFLIRVVCLFVCSWTSLLKVLKLKVCVATSVWVVGRDDRFWQRFVFERSWPTFTLLYVFYFFVSRTLLGHSFPLSFRSHYPLINLFCFFFLFVLHLFLHFLLLFSPWLPFFYVSCLFLFILDIY